MTAAIGVRPAPSRSAGSRGRRRQRRRGGTVTALLGPNGAGKTTTLRMLLGWQHRAAGPRRSVGSGTTELTDPVRRVGAVLESSGCHPGRTALDHLRILATASRLPKDAPMRVLAETGLAADARRRVGEFSLGMRQRLGLAAAMLGDPDVLVLDEPTNGLDPPGVRWLRGYVRQLADEGRTVLVSSHALSEVEQTADHVLVLAQGRAAPIVEARRAARRGGRRLPSAHAGPGSTQRGARRRRPHLSSDGGGTRRRRVAEEVGDLAAAHGVVLHGLVATADLEQAFFRLIEESGATQHRGSNEAEEARG